MRAETPPPFDEVRMLAWDFLQRVERSGAFADLLLDSVFSKNPKLRVLDRAFISELVLGTLRWRSRLDLAIHRAAKFPEKKIDPKLLHLLRLGAYQILFMDRVPPFAAVNESVRLAKAAFKSEKISGFTNAVLRSVSRNKTQEGFPPFEKQPVEYITQVLSHPRWMVERWVREFGPDMARKMCEANNLRPPFTVRVNTLKTTRKILQERLAEAGIQSLPAPYSPEGLILQEGLWLSEEPLFQERLLFRAGRGFPDRCSSCKSSARGASAGCLRRSRREDHSPGPAYERSGGDHLLGSLWPEDWMDPGQLPPYGDSHGYGSCRPMLPSPCPFPRNWPLTGSWWMRPARDSARSIATPRPSGAKNPGTRRDCSVSSFPFWKISGPA